MSAQAHLYQVAYTEATFTNLMPGFRPLDNRANLRPDWFEFDPIRRFWAATPAVDENAFYGFFSPKFTDKTGHTADTIHARLVSQGEQLDVLLLSPFPNQIAFFTNVFEQGEFFHRGLMGATQRWLAAVGLDPALASLWMDVRQTVFSNYFVARPAFWREWLVLADKLWNVCEGPATPLQIELTANTAYLQQAQLKVFLQERLASLLLVMQPRWRGGAVDPYLHGRWPTEALRADPTDAIVSDALKHALRQQPWQEYINAFGIVRQRVLGGASK
ncbi:MAG TPA: hypothetical protein VIN58_10555 [Roseateles sp.]